MKSYRFFLAMLVMTFLAGCAPVDSLNPLYTDKDVVFDKALLGQWGSPKEGLTFVKLRDNAYRMVITQKKDDEADQVSVVFEAHLVNLQGHRFLDLVCEESAGDEQPIPEVRITHTKGGLEIE